MATPSTYSLPAYGIVSTVHILKSGEVVSNVQEYMKVEDRFSWVDRSFIVSKILRLRSLTDESKRSVIVIYEDGQQIREFVNVDETFKPLLYY
jgi:hypothetical protein